MFLLHMLKRHKIYLLGVILKVLNSGRGRGNDPFLVIIFLIYAMVSS